MEKLSEQNILLTPEELKKLKNQRSKAIFILFAFFIIAFGSMSYFLFFKISPEGFMNIPLIIFMIFFFGVFAFIAYANLNKFNTDIKNAVKLSISGEVIKKLKEIHSSYSRGSRGSNVTYTYSVNISGKEIKNMSYNVYKLLHTGSKIHLEIAPLSMVIFDYQELNTPIEKPVNVKEEVLFEDEIISLKSKRNKRIGRAFLFTLLIGVISLIILLLMLFFFSDQNSENPLLYIVSILLVVVLPLFLPAFFIYRTIKIWRLYSKDIYSGIKEVFTTWIDELINSNAKVLDSNVIVTSTLGEYYYVDIKGKKIRITKEQFESITEDTKVKVYRAKYSQLILNAELIFPSH